MAAEHLPLLHLALTPGQIEDLCLALPQQFRPSQVLAALVALQSLLSLMPPGSREDATYREVQALLAAHAETARLHLLRERAVHLGAALARRDIPAVVRIHGGLSRNGFWQVAASAADRAAPDEMAATLEWLGDWCRAAETRAAAASGYPDALDFRGLDVTREEYLALAELLHCLRAA